MPKTEITAEDELLSRFQMSESQKFYDRANFFIAAEAFLFQAFVAAIVGFGKLEGYLVWIPLVIFAIGISLDSIYILSSYVQIHTVLEPLSEDFEKRYNEVAAGSSRVLGLYRSEFSAKKQTPTTVTNTQTPQPLNAEPIRLPGWLSRWNLKDVVYKWVPTILFVGWFLMLIPYFLQWIG